MLEKFVVRSCMGLNRRSNASWVLGPRALAVLSCALALLAAQPVIAAERATARGAEVRVERLVQTPTAELAGALSSESTRRSRGTTPQRFLGSWESARRLHVLATVEILHRLLIAEFRPALTAGAERQLAAIMIFAPLQPVAFVTVSTGTTVSAPPVTPSLHSHERAFAIVHCLLAPPAA